ncbi:TPA: type 4b pilus protein PilO2 [Burkholderia cenocepacia]|uniref:Type 4b pilus protein PilO2 n=1 Tax=Burkholderia vietnamiensis TaxID=60552 RepID=A0ABS1AXF9_BURVI|nr:type 4b pilus protein PilO2 [Burkholderia vietnamiensis]MBJ9688844.1 type 4b pilus protein PilO2 [Burkholderia vietnamiensis]
MAEILTLSNDNPTLYAVGFTWLAEPAMPKPAQLRELSRVRGIWGVARKTTDGVQLGFGDLPHDTRRPTAIRALASVVADYHPAPWLGVYRLNDELSWLIAVRADGIAPNGDLVGSHDEIQAAAAALKAGEHWTSVSGSPADLAEMARLAGKQPGLRDWRAKISPVVRNGLIAAGVGVVAIGAVAVWTWRQDLMQEAALLASQRAQIQAEHAKRARLLASPPWKLAAAPAQLIDACHRAWLAQPLAQDGWKLEVWQCRQAGANLNLTMNWVRAGGSPVDAPGRLIDGEHAQSASTRPGPGSAVNAAAGSDEEAQRTIWALADTVSGQLTLGTVPALPCDVKVLKDLPPWQIQGVSLTNTMPPWVYPLSALAGETSLEAPIGHDGRSWNSVPGFVLDTLTWTAGKDWQASGTLYSWRPSGAIEQQMMGCRQSARTTVGAKA